MRGVVRGERPSWGRRRCLPERKGEWPRPAGVACRAGLQGLWSSCLWVTSEGGKHLAVSVSDRKLPAPISPAPAALSAAKLWV